MAWRGPTIPGAVKLVGGGRYLVTATRVGWQAEEWTGGPVPAANDFAEPWSPARPCRSRPRATRLCANGSSAVAHLTNHDLAEVSARTRAEPPKTTAWVCSGTARSPTAPPVRARGRVPVRPGVAAHLYAPAYPATASASCAPSGGPCSVGRPSPRFTAAAFTTGGTVRCPMEPETPRRAPCSFAPPATARRPCARRDRTGDVDTTMMARRVRPAGQSSNCGNRTCRSVCSIRDRGAPQCEPAGTVTSAGMRERGRALTAAPQAVLAGHDAGRAGVAVSGALDNVPTPDVIRPPCGGTFDAAEGARIAALDAVGFWDESRQAHWRLVHAEVLQRVADVGATWLLWERFYAEL